MPHSHCKLNQLKLYQVFEQGPLTLSFEQVNQSNPVIWLVKI